MIEDKSNFTDVKDICDKNKRKMRKWNNEEDQR